MSKYSCYSYHLILFLYLVVPSRGDAVVPKLASLSSFLGGENRDDGNEGEEGIKRSSTSLFSSFSSIEFLSGAFNLTDPDGVTEMSDLEFQELGFPLPTETPLVKPPTHSQYPEVVLNSPFFTFFSNPPEITDPPKDITVRSGGIAAFYCYASGDPKPHILWRKDGEKISYSQTRYLISEFRGGSLLRIEPARRKFDDSKFECLAENGSGDPVSATSTLKVVEDNNLPTGFPEIKQHPGMKVVEKAHNALLVCQAAGNPSVNVYWVKDTMKLDVDSNPRLTILKQGKLRGSLQIKDSQESDQGKYECVAENSVGTQYSYAAQVYVRVRRVPPTFSVQPDDVYNVMMGSSLNLTCVGVGSPMPYVKWRKGSQDMSALTPPIGRNVLELQDISESANYTCVAASKLGIIEHTTLVQVQARPRAPTNVRLSDVTPTTVRLSWSYPGNNAEVMYYTIQYKPKLASWDYKEVSGIITDFYDIRGLSPFTEYEFVILAVNNVGRGEPSTPVVATTGETDGRDSGKKPGSAPRNVRVRPLSSSTMVIQWDEPQANNGQITGYKVYYTTNPSDSLTQWESQFVDNNKLTTISELIPHTIYTIKVEAYTAIGPGPPSEAVQVKTQQGVPSQPSNFRVIEVRATTMTLAWSSPSHSGENIVSYELYWNDTFTNDFQNQKSLDIISNYTLEGLYPNTLYHVWLGAKSRRGEGATTPPIAVRTEQYVPGAPPDLVKAYAESSTSLRVVWSPPPPGKRNGKITYYEIYYVPSARPDSEATMVEIKNPEAREYVIDELRKYTEYRLWMLAGTSVGDGPISYPVVVKTGEDVPGEPLNIRALAINSSSVQVHWDPPTDDDKNGVIRGYQIYVKPKSSESEYYTMPLRFITRNGKETEFNVTGLQPDTRYVIQVAALTRIGDGTRSKPVKVKTPGGVPSRPNIDVKLIKKDPTITMDIEWTKPVKTYGELKGYRVRYGRRGFKLTEILITDKDVQHQEISNLEKGIEYEFRIAGINKVGSGQEAIKPYLTPEGVPTDSPKNITTRFQTPDVIEISYDAPPEESRNGQITMYDIQFWKAVSPEEKRIRSTTERKTVFANLEDNTEYKFSVRANTRKGYGPWSTQVSFRTDRNIIRAPLNVQAMATSGSSIEVWWEAVPLRTKVIGYEIFYTMTEVDDLDKWQRKTVGLVTSADLINLESDARYAVAVAARTHEGLGRLSQRINVKVRPRDVVVNLRARDVTTHTMTLSWGQPIHLTPINYKISYNAYKEFVDAQGITQSATIPTITILVSPKTTEYVIKDLSPFTTYHVNVTAIPPDRRYRPPAKITVTTQMAAPQPMVKPDFYGVRKRNKGELTVFLPQASEEYGPISHYYLVVIPNSNSSTVKYPDQYDTVDLVANSKRKNKNRGDEDEPYIAAKFLQRAIPYTFVLGNGENHEGFINRKLEEEKMYKIFVRAYVDTPQKHLYTSSPFSPELSLGMTQEPPGPPPQRPRPGRDMYNGENPKGMPNHDTSSMIWVVGPVIAGIALALLVVLIVVLRRRRQNPKQALAGDDVLVGGLEQGAVMTPLMSGFESAGNNNCAVISYPPPPPPSDPVELRRLNFQTPGMISHPPIPVNELALRIDDLKGNDNLKFSQEYESIEPGQQFTWDNSSMEINKPKNRYANVIAYDHSRVVLQPVDGVPGSDYINGNYCDGYRKQNAYIATQGPLPETFADFWRMVWEQRSSTIVMLTKLEERARLKCDQYWPTRGTESYGVMSVTLTDTQELATYVIRTFQLQRVSSLNMGFTDRREVKQFQYTAWPDHGVPEHPAPFLLFLRRINCMNPMDAGPVITHCSAGVGRTGAFIVIDSMLERIKNEKTIDVYGHVTCLRAQRNYMVQTEDQYVFIHDALLEAVMAGHTEVSARNLHHHIQTLMQTEPGENVTGMEMEFKKLSNVKAEPARFMSANLPVNKFKNRLVNILPFETSRVCLQPIRGVEGSDYINASYIDGYRYRNAYIATQGPLNETIEDFWRMLWEHNSTIVVMLTKQREMGREKCAQYWPNDRSARYQFFVVDPIAEYNMPQYLLREFKVTDARDGQSRTVRQFQFTDWPEQGVPKSGDGFIEFIGQVHKTKEQFGQEGPITVHCSAGVGRTGVFITLSIVLERLQYEGVVDTFQTVRALRTQRPAMVQTEDQYQFCYRAALEYLSSFDQIYPE
ncbi:tyrosine-protein phosphatase Lar isoform X1 [Lepeophtheirus salmonis]|nr:tyrosine-protein phosphatase Lar-like isoform X2 [Lepeophtheirus salmonis]